MGVLGLELELGGSGRDAKRDEVTSGKMVLVGPHEACSVVGDICFLIDTCTVETGLHMCQALREEESCKLRAPINCTS